MDWNSILSGVLQAVLIAAIPPLVAAGVQWLLAKAKLALAKVAESKPGIMEMLEFAAEFAVKAAEQAQLGKLIEDKKAYAVGVAEKWLETKGLQVDLDLIEAAIEKAVLEIFNAEVEPEGMGFTA